MTESLIHRGRTVRFDPTRNDRAAIERALAVYDLHGAIRASAESGVPAPTVRGIVRRSGLRYPKGVINAAQTLGVTIPDYLAECDRLRALYERGHRTDGTPLTTVHLGEMFGLGSRSVAARIQAAGGTLRPRREARRLRNMAGGRARVLAVCRDAARLQAEGVRGWRLAAGALHGVHGTTVGRYWRSPVNVYGPNYDPTNG